MNRVEIGLDWKKRDILRRKGIQWKRKTLKERSGTECSVSVDIGCVKQKGKSNESKSQLKFF